MTLRSKYDFSDNMSIQETRQNCYETQTLSFLMPYFIPLEILANTYSSICVQHTLQLFLCHASKAPLFSPKEKLTFTIYYLHLCQV